MNPGLESLRMVHILEVCGGLYLKREVNTLCGCRDLIAKMFYEGNNGSGKDWVLGTVSMLSLPGVLFLPSY